MIYLEVFLQISLIRELYFKSISLNYHEIIINFTHDDYFSKGLVNFFFSDDII
jgi:hypothetical protein